MNSFGAGEQSSLEERPDFDHLDLEVDQMGLLPWGIAAALMVFPTWFLAVVWPLAMIVGLPLFLMTFVLLFAGTARPSKVRLSLGPDRLEVTGWVGRLPRPVETQLSTRTLTLDWKAGAVVNDIQIFSLRLTDGDQDLYLPGVRCTTSELEAIRDRLAGYRALGEARHGEGEEEVPPDLRSMRQVDEAP